MLDLIIEMLVYVALYRTGEGSLRLLTLGRFKRSDNPSPTRIFFLCIVGGAVWFGLFVFVVTIEQSSA
ncbi:MAG: hypothetical protein KDH20_00460 [Rhodocyclaceae bacterium]|nr:hypothetical protein [Rhodocyclaceae bacterium]